MRNSNTGVFGRLNELLDYLEDVGYGCHFVLHGDKMYCPETDEKFSPEELKVVGTFRFEGESNPSDMSVVYVVETKGKARGAIVDAFGTYGTPEIGAFIEQVRDRRDGSWIQDAIAV